MKKYVKVTLAASALALASGLGATTASAAAGGGHQSGARVTATMQAAASFAQTVCYSNVNDGQVLTYTNNAITASQPIVASASEGVLYGEGMNQANVYSEGVTVIPGQVDVRIHTGWGAPLYVCLHLIG